MTKLEIALLVVLAVVILVVFLSIEKPRSPPSRSADTATGLIPPGTRVWQVHLYMARWRFHQQHEEDSRKAADLASSDVNAIVHHLTSNPQFIASMDAVEECTKTLREKGESQEAAFAQAWQTITNMDVTKPWDIAKAPS